MAHSSRTVAIACQGGGSHTAFTAGVLGELLSNWPEDCRLVGLSGTSGGAVCATLAWWGLVNRDLDPSTLLKEFWRDLSATHPFHRTVNHLVRWSIQLQRAGIPVPEVSPANAPGSRWAQQEFGNLLESYIDFEEMPARSDDTTPGLFVSAIDVCNGRFKIFRADEISREAILASAAEPHVFEAVEIDGAYYWDGLFAKNPPLSEFMSARDIPDPDEIWMIEINPRSRERVPRTIEGIDNRRNELAGNLSTGVEARFIERVNEWVEAGHLPEQYTPTDIQYIRFARADLDWRTKLDRDPRLINRFIRDGNAAARRFLHDRS